jgi:hypothetical protein
MIACILLWINDYVKSRIGSEWRISRGDNCYIMKCFNHSKSIVIMTTEDGFYNRSIALGCDYWDSIIEGYQNPFDDKYIMPGNSHLKGKNLIEKEHDKVIINYDIFGLIFWISNRLEELSGEGCDKHERFKYQSSHAFRYNYVKRPVVDEWVELLIEVVRRNFNDYPIKVSCDSLKISCDVDRPYKNNVNARAFPRRFAGDILKRRSLKDAFKTVKYSIFKSYNNLKDDDWYNNIFWLMDVNERFNNKVQFNFLVGGHHVLDGHYDVNSKNIISLMKYIRDRGHGIGLHPSYMTFNNFENTIIEVDRLRRVLDELGMDSENIKSRQHYLRWDQKITPIILKSCGVVEDSTLGYADVSGFRAGTCHQYKLYNHEKGGIIDLIESPLIAMESTIIENSGYTEQSMSDFLELSQRCRQVGGCYTLLWHNSDLNSDSAKLFYEKLISKI